MVTVRTAERAVPLQIKTERSRPWPHRQHRGSQACRCSSHPTAECGTNIEAATGSVGLGRSGNWTQPRHAPSRSDRSAARARCAARYTLTLGPTKTLAGSRGRQQKWADRAGGITGTLRVRFWLWCTTAQGSKNHKDSNPRWRGSGRRGSRLMQRQQPAVAGVQRITKTATHP